MKTAILTVAALACTVACVAGGGDAASAGDDRKTAEYLPNRGYVADAAAALQIGKAVLAYMLSPGDFKKKEFSKAELKDGIWIVSYWEVKARINLPVVIQVRQKTGAIVKYEDPNA